MIFVQVTTSIRSTSNSNPSSLPSLPCLRHHPGTVAHPSLPAPPSPEQEKKVGFNFFLKKYWCNFFSENVVSTFSKEMLAQLFFLKKSGFNFFKEMLVQLFFRRNVGSNFSPKKCCSTFSKIML